MPYAYTQTVLEVLRAQPETKPDAKVYALVDGARSDLLQPETATSGHKSYCLFKGKLPVELAAAAPWLVELSDLKSDYCSWLIGEGWG